MDIRRFWGPNGNLLDEDLYCFSSTFINGGADVLDGYSSSIYLRFGKDLYTPTQELKKTYVHNFKEFRNDAEKKNYISNSVSIGNINIDEEYVTIDIKASLTMAGLSKKFVNTVQIVVWVKEDMNDDNEIITSEKIIWEYKAVLDTRGLHCYGALSARDVVISESIDSVNVNLDADEKRIRIPEGIDPSRIEVVSFVDGKSEIDPSELFIKEMSEKVVISPNPASNSVDFTYQVPDNQEHFTLELLDQESNIVIQKTMETAAKNRYSIDCSTLNSGVYFLRIKAGEAIETKRVIITK